MFYVGLTAGVVDRVHSVFGQVISGEAILRMIENLPTDTNSRPTCDVHISNCGELVLQLKPKGTFLSVYCM